MSHTTLVGAAVAVVVTVPALAVAVSVCQALGSIHSQVATPTSCSEPAVGTEMLVEPGVAEGRGDALRLSPDKEGFDQRVRVPKRPQPPGTGVGHLDADAAEQ